MTPLLRDLHWLPVQARIEYKISTLCHSFFNGTAPEYLSALHHVHVPSRQLRSSDSKLLRVPHVRTKSFGQRSFSYVAPSVWKSLPQEVRNTTLTSEFKTALKTHLFKKHLDEPEG